MSHRDERGIYAATYAAENSSLRVRVGAATSRGGDMIGWNQRKTHPRIVKAGYPAGSTLHAELDLIISLGYYGLRGETVYISRLLRDGTTGLAKPCPLCMQALAACGVKRLVWTTDVEGKLGEVSL